MVVVVVVVVVVKLYYEGNHLRLYKRIGGSLLFCETHEKRDLHNWTSLADVHLHNGFQRIKGQSLGFDFREIPSPLETFPKTSSSSLKNGCCETIPFLLGCPIFRGELLSFRV